jgi:hypothetical protein
MPRKGKLFTKTQGHQMFCKNKFGPIAENLRFRNTKIILLSSQTSKESTSLILDLKISQNPRKVSLCKRRKFPKHLFVLFQENISCFKQINIFYTQPKETRFKTVVKREFRKFLNILTHNRNIQIF